MGFWSWFANRIDHFFHDPTDNVNNGLIANPFLVKQTPMQITIKSGASSASRRHGPTHEHRTLGCV